MIITRFAPSPTGFLHLGGARTALFNWLLARQSGGKFILRIEDTDTARNTDASVDQIFDSLKWLGIDWDDGPYYQSERTHLYNSFLEVLKDKDMIYPAFDTMEELELARQSSMRRKVNPIYNGDSKNYSKSEGQQKINSGIPHVWRFRVPDETIIIPETLMSDMGVTFKTADLGDFVITRTSIDNSFGSPLYNFCCVIDDALMNITNVIRGVEHLSNTPKQMLIYKALGFDIPTFTHLPLIMTGKKKMSKRDGDTDPLHPVSVSARRDLGYLPEATINFLGMLGWSDPEGLEIFTKDHLLKNFSLDRLGKSNANFDEPKYSHTNAVYLRKMDLDTLTDMVIPYLEKDGIPEVRELNRDWLKTIVAMEQERCKILSEYPDALRYFIIPPTEYDATALKKFGNNEVVQDIIELLSGMIFNFDKENLDREIRTYAENKGMKLMQVGQTIRLALTGRTNSPGLFEVMAALGLGNVIKRLDNALNNWK